MPYKSTAQMKFMHAKHPEIAKKWDKKYGVPKGMPMHVAIKKGRKVKKNKKSYANTPNRFTNGTNQ